MRTVKIDVTFESDDEDTVVYSFSSMPAYKFDMDLQWEDPYRDELFLSPFLMCDPSVVKRLSIGIDYPPVGQDGVLYTVTKRSEGGQDGGMAAISGGNGS